MTESHAQETIPDLLPRLRAIVGRIAGFRDVDDLVQECCVRILEKEHQYRGEGQGFGAWAAAVTRNVTRTVLTQSGRLRETEMEAPEAVPERGLSKEEERVGWILDQLPRLPEEQRELLKLRYFDGLTVEAVGQRLGISQAGASQRLEKALVSLRKRATRQGWMSSFLPASWALGLASTSPMKLSLLGAGALTATLATPHFFTPDPETPVQGNVASMEHTELVPSLNSPLRPKRNQLWCGTLSLAMKALESSLDQPFDPTELDPVSAAMVTDPFHTQHIDGASYVAVGGLDSARLLEEAQTQLQQRFGQGRDPVLDEAAGMAPVLAYAFLYKAMQFPITFFDLKEHPLTFTNPDKTRKDVQTWGFDDLEIRTEVDSDRIKQLRIVYYGGPEDFVLEFLPESSDPIVIARLKPGKTLLETWQKIQTKRKAYANLTAEERLIQGWQGGESLHIPKLDFDLQQVFPKLRLALPDPTEAHALQTLRVRLDHRGAEVKSRGMVLRGSAGLDIKEFRLDGPFVVGFVHGKAEIPYAMLWVAHSELLVPRIEAESAPSTNKGNDGY